jgi:hypothetical protein
VINTFSQLQPKNWHGLAPMMGHQEPVSHCITTYKTHMENIQWSGVISCGLKTAIGISFWLMFNFNDILKWSNFQPQLQPKNWHGLAPMGHQEPVSHCITNYKTHMEDIQWSEGNSCGFMTANGISFG